MLRPHFVLCIHELVMEVEENLVAPTISKVSTIITQTQKIYSTRVDLPLRKKSKLVAQVDISSSSNLDNWKILQI